jgi:hypothetical protein
MDPAQQAIEQLKRRVVSLEGIVRGLTREQLDEFAAVVRAQQSARTPWPADERFWFDGTGGAIFSKTEDTLLRDLWTHLNAALVFVASGREIDEWIQGPGLVAHLDRLSPVRQQIEGQAAAILERQLGATVWLAATGIWNALCAALVGDRVDSSVRASLQASWITVVGSPLTT